VADERSSNLRRFFILLALIVLIAISAAIGLLVANGPEYLRYFTARG